MTNNAQEQEILNRFVEWGSAQNGVRAMVLTSSRASPTSPVDVFSDYDLILVLDDIYPFFHDRGWLDAFGRVLVLYRDPILREDGLEASGYIVQYEDGLKIDFTLWTGEHLRRVVSAPTLPAEFDAGYRVLLDKDSLTDELKPATYRGYIPAPPTETEYLEHIEVFFVDTTYVAKLLWRDDVIAAKHVLDHYAKREHLLPMLEWRSEIDHNWMVKPGPFGRGLKTWLRPDLWQSLETTYTGADVEANWNALFGTIALFRQVAVEVGDLLGFAYPHEMDQRVMAYLQKVKTTPSDARANT